MHRHLFITLISVFIFFSNTGFANPFEGSWELLSGEYMDDEGKIVKYEDKKLKSIKVISGTHFSFITMSGDKFWSSGAGTYVYNENIYTETPLFTSYGAEKGIVYSFTYRIETNLWYNSRWKNKQRVEYEIWRKL